MVNKTYEQENNEILLSTLTNIFYKNWHNLNAKNIPHQDRFNMPAMEIYLSPDCTQNCSYCYLCKNKDGLYPAELRNEEVILKNLKITLDYAVTHKLNPARFDIFAGDMWDTEFGLRALGIVVDAIKRGFRPGLWMIPSNCNFLMNAEATQKIEEYMQAAKDNDVRFIFSCSNDGYYIDKMTRPLNNPEAYGMEKGSEEYYETIFKFCKKWKLGFHPMVSAHGIEFWQENYKWWMEQFKKYDFNPLDSIMFLETRNDDWTEEKIKSYLKFLNYYIDFSRTEGTWNWHSEYNKYDAKKLFNLWRTKGLDEKSKGHYSPLRIGNGSYNMGCTVNRALCIRMGDLAIVPCHRTSYNEFVIGYLEVNDDNIVGVKANNIQMMNQVWFNNMLGVAKCNNCKYSEQCMKGCYGSQFEANQDMFYPCSTVCDLYQARAIFLYHKYTKIDDFTSNSRKDTEFLEFIETIKGTEVYDKWTAIAQEILC